MSTHIERAIEQIQVKQPQPEIDWTLHTLEDGNVVSTQERVIKDVCYSPSLSGMPLNSNPPVGVIGSSARDASPNPTAILQRTWA